MSYGEYTFKLAEDLATGIPQGMFSRKTVKCSLCKNQTRNKGYVCSDCVTLFSAGFSLLAQAEQKDSEIKKPHRVGLPKLYRRGDKFEFGSKSKLFLNIARRLAGSKDEHGSRTIFMTEDQLKAYRDLIEFCCRLAMENYKKGHGDGHGMIRRLASGDLSIQELNKINMGGKS